MSFKQTKLSAALMRLTDVHGDPVCVCSFVLIECVGEFPVFTQCDEIEQKYKNL